MNKLERDDQGMYLFWCPGCETHHYFQTEGQPRWQWNGSLTKPHVKPSIKVTFWDRGVYHLFIRDGMIKYLNDCYHDLKGKTVPMVPIDEV